MAAAISLSNEQLMIETTYWKCDCPHCAGHLEFPADAAGQKVTCPHCQGEMTLTPPAPLPSPPLHAPPAKTKGRGPAGLIVVSVIVVVIVATVAGPRVLRKRQKSDSDAIAKPAPTSPAGRPASSVVPPAPAPDSVSASDELHVTAITLQRPKDKGSSLIYVVGIVRNDAERQRFGVKVEFDLFDRSEKKVGRARDYLSILEPHKEWRCKALVLDAKAVSAKLASIKEDQ